MHGDRCAVRAVVVADVIVLVFAGAVVKAVLCVGDGAGLLCLYRAQAKAAC